MSLEGVYAAGKGKEKGGGGGVQGLSLESLVAAFPDFIASGAGWERESVCERERE